jgi:hypothetical protein
MTKAEGNVMPLSKGEAKQYIEDKHSAMAGIGIAGEPIITGAEPEPKVKCTVKTISATYERKFNLGEYESASIGVTSWADVEPEQEPAEAINALQDLCKSQVRKQAENILGKRKNGGVEYTELKEKYAQLEIILNDALSELQSQEPHEEEYKALVDRLNAL